MERDANAIAQETRRGKGNMILCSADVASALTMAGVLDYTPALNANLNVDDTGNTFAGVLQGKYRVYIDPFAANVSATQYYVIGYKGSSPYDAGLFYCPYVPLQMVRALVRIHSNQKLDSRPDMVWLRTHSHKVTLQTKVLEHLHVTRTVTTEELRLLTLCNKYLVRDIQRLLRGLFFYQDYRYLENYQFGVGNITLIVVFYKDPEFNQFKNPEKVFAFLCYRMSSRNWINLMIFIGFPLGI